MASEFTLKSQDILQHDNVATTNQEADYSKLLLSDEVVWRTLQPWLADRGYMLRPRYRPDWVPSWLPGEGFPLVRFEDGYWTVVSTVIVY